MSKHARSFRSQSRRGWSSRDVMLESMGGGGVCRGLPRGDGGDWVAFIREDKGSREHFGERLVHRNLLHKIGYFSSE
jgi:hypothetical protein